MDFSLQNIAKKLVPNLQHDTFPVIIRHLLISGDMMIVQRVLSADPDTFQSHMGSADRMCLSPSDYSLK